MTTADAMIVFARFFVVLALYVIVAGVLLFLRRDLAGTRRAALPPVAGARLTLVDAAPEDGPVGRSIPLSGTLSIGRRPPADVLLNDDAVSGQHARFHLRHGKCVVEDMGSTNGTFVNGRRIDRPVALAAGDVVTIGLAAWRLDEEAA